MIDEGGVVDMLLAAQHVGAVEAAFDMTAADMGAQLVARQPAADAQHEAVVDGVVGEASLAGGEVIGVLPLVLQLVMTERSEEHTSELQSLMRISYSVFCLKKKTEK